MRVKIDSEMLLKITPSPYCLADNAMEAAPNRPQSSMHSQGIVCEPQVHS